MRPITISLDEETWKEAKKKTNFSGWIRNQLRSERNRTPQTTRIKELENDLRLLQVQCDMYWNAFRELQGKESSNEDE